MQTGKFRTYIITGILLAVILGIALYFRIALPYEKVFVDDWIKYTGTDAYYFMRYVDNFVHNFPQFTYFDPYLRFPDGFSPGSIFFVVVLGTITWLFGAGSPSPQLVDIIGVYFPAVICSLSIIPMYFVGKVLFNRWAGIIAAGLLAILPGESLGRTILGYTDRDALEILLALLSILFMILAIKCIQAKTDDSESPSVFKWSRFKKPFVYSIFTGIFLGLYLLTWRGSFIFVIIFLIYLIVQVIVNYFKNRNINYLCALGTITLVITLIIYMFSSPGSIYLASILIAIAIPVVLGLIAYISRKFLLKPAYFVLIILLIGIIFLAIFYFINSSLFITVFSTLLDTFISESTTLTIMEMQPILFPSGQFTFILLWLNFTTGAILCLVSLILLIRSNIKKDEPHHIFLIIWSLAILIAMLMIRRFALLFAINVAVLTAYVSWLILKAAGCKETAQQTISQIKIADEAHKSKKSDRKALKKKDKARTGNLALQVLAVIFVFLLVFLPNFIYAADTASKVSFVPSNGWYESLNWLKDNSREPFDVSDSYNRVFDSSFEFSEDSYGVVSWWDYGYRILRIANRPTNCDPGGAIVRRENVARFFAAQDEESANNIINKLRSKYIIVDDLTALPTKFYAVATYAGKTRQDFYDNYYRDTGSSLEPVTLFYPEYYKAMSTRLYNFDGTQVIPTSTYAISYTDKIDRAGASYKEITDMKTFTDYSAATDFIQSNVSSNYRIVGFNPFISPVPLEEVTSYKLIYNSKEAAAQPEVGRVSTIKIFEYSD